MTFDTAPASPPRSHVIVIPRPRGGARGSERPALIRRPWIRSAAARPASAQIVLSRDPITVRRAA